MSITNEEWRSIDGYINYQVSNIGRVRNANTGRILKPARNKKTNYYNVGLSNDAGRKTWDIHRLVALDFLEKPEGDDNHKFDADHIDNNRLNNKVNNLRWATHQQNIMNKSKGSKRTTSIYKGVWKETAWRAGIKYNAKTIHLGSFKTEDEAARAYNAKALELFGEFAKLNEL